GTTNVGLFDDPPLLFQAMLTARPSTAAEGIRRDGLFLGGVHLNPTWTPTMCPHSTSSPPPPRPAMWPGSDAYIEARAAQSEICPQGQRLTRASPRSTIVRG